MFVCIRVISGYYAKSSTAGWTAVSIFTLHE